MKLKLILVLLLVILGYLLTPIYGFLSHKDKLPMLPFGQQTMPHANAPMVSKVHNSDYAIQAADAIAMLEKHREVINSPGFTAAVAINNQLVWQGAAGWADLKHALPMQTDTQLRIGSTSKALTSAGLARAVASHKLTLDTPLKDLYEHLPNPNWAQITPRQLASHMAGLPHYGQNTEFSGLLKSMTLDHYYEHVDDAVALFDESKLLGKPGERFEYSSLGTVLLSQVIEKATGESYTAWMQHQVFSPLKLSHTQIEQKATKLAQFYKQDKSDSEQFYVWRKVDLSHRLAAGGWVSTSSDLAQFGQGFMQSDFIPADVREAFYEPQRLNNGEVNPQNYAIGWRKHQISIDPALPEVDYYSHGGVSRGAQSFLMVIPEYQFSLAVNINRNVDEFGDFSKIAGQLSRLFLRPQGIKRD
ncbi:serine hydrolase domain-containing protein [Neptunicella marina]|uniref:Beta-lactamase family protein n=1 Tax=Neptunicella marina TaxID=2125989 RepID=A0A8J6IP28_9ALTE|nr:serine hydrolase domain-containing protein [Neptunicella marina]MBC3764641.1 beta-lactamase family protein [Neptunicella marina]